MDSGRRPHSTSWMPSSRDTGQVDEYTLDEAAFIRVCEGLSEDEACTRATRATEIERVIAELWFAAAVVARTEAARAAIDDSVDDWAVATIATLNLMGIETILPGEGPVEAADVDSERARIHLKEPTGGGWIAGTLDQLDALSGLIRDFQRSTIFVNGLRLDSSEVGGGVVQWSLVAVHPGLIAGFGEFLMRKYINEGWSLA